MQLKTIHSTPAVRRLMLVFAGWSADWRPFADVQIPGYDLAVVWDYRDNIPDFTEISRVADGYSEIVVVAWSMGVSMAARFVHPAITRRIAINGTLRPIGDALGIPVRIFDGTLAGLNERNLVKFRRRIGASGAIGTDDVAMLRDELANISRLNSISPAPAVRFDVAVISTRDLIFPPDNMRRAWQGTAVIEIDEPHMPDFAALLPRMVIDKDLVSSRFRRVMSTSYPGSSSVQAQIATSLWDMTRPYVERMSSPRILEIGAGSGLLTRQYAQFFPAADITLVDLVDLSHLAASNVTTVTTDAETYIDTIADDTFDIILSSSTVQWLNSPLRFMQRCCRKLRKGGVVALSTFTPDNLSALRPFMAPQLVLPSLRGWVESVPEGYSVAFASEALVEARFGSSADLLKHLRDTGVNAIRRPDGEGASIARHILAEFPTNADGSCALDYRPIYLGVIN